MAFCLVSLINLLKLIEVSSADINSLLSFEGLRTSGYRLHLVGFVFEMLNS